MGLCAGELVKSSEQGCLSARCPAGLSTGLEAQDSSVLAFEHNLRLLLVADKKLSALLAGNQLVPIVHKTTYAALRYVSPLLASRGGLATAEDSMAVVAAKIAELVAGAV